MFSQLFPCCMLSSLLAFAIAIPFFIRDYSSLPLSVGILTGTMWVPLSRIIRHPIGLVHAFFRTLLVLGAWYLFAQQRFLLIPLLIVALYLLTILVLETR